MRATLRTAQSSRYRPTWTDGRHAALKVAQLLDSALEDGDQTKSTEAWHYIAMHIFREMDGEDGGLDLSRSTLRMAGRMRAVRLLNSLRKQGFPDAELKAALEAFDEFVEPWTPDPATGEQGRRDAYLHTCFHDARVKRIPLPRNATTYTRWMNEHKDMPTLTAVE